MSCGTAVQAADPAPTSNPALALSSGFVSFFGGEGSPIKPSVDEQAKLRALDAVFEDGNMRSPLAGMFPPNLPVPSLQTALQEIGQQYPHLDPVNGRTVKMARAKVNEVDPNIKSTMSADEAAALVLYTMEETPREQSLYFLMNQALRSMNRGSVHVWKHFIWLQLNAMKKLPPPETQDVYRGIKFELGYTGVKPKLVVGHTVTRQASLKSSMPGPPLTDSRAECVLQVTWSGFSSTATTNSVMQTFLGTEGERIMCASAHPDHRPADSTAGSLHASSPQLACACNLVGVGTTSSSSSRSRATCAPSRCTHRRMSCSSRPTSVL